jgi:hypothetical protein
MKPKINRATDAHVPQGMDFCQTPAYAIYPLLQHLAGSDGQQKPIVWEPAAGEGNLAEALADRHIKVVTSDLRRGAEQDFFSYEPPQWDIQVTNPPYSIKPQWIERSFALGKPFALLLPVESIGAAAIARQFAGKRIEIVFTYPRIAFKMPDKGWVGSAPQFPVAWFTYGLGIGQEISYWFFTAEERQWVEARRAPAGPVPQDMKGGKA